MDLFYCDTKHTDIILYALNPTQQYQGCSYLTPGAQRCSTHALEYICDMRDRV